MWSKGHLWWRNFFLLAFHIIFRRFSARKIWAEDQVQLRLYILVFFFFFRTLSWNTFAMRGVLMSILLRCNEITARCPRKIVGRYYATGAKPELTSIRYKTRRGPYAMVTDADVRFFDSLLGSNRLITDPDECESYNIDFMKSVRGKHKT